MQLGFVIYHKLYTGAGVYVYVFSPDVAGGEAL